MRNNLLDKGRESRCVVCFPGRFIGDGAGRKINRYLVAVCNLRRRFGALQNREADVDGVAVENAREARRNDAGDAARADGNRRMFAGGTAAEVRAADDDVPGCTFCAKVASMSSMQCFASSSGEGRSGSARG